MSKQFEEIFNKLQYASPVKAKQILRELESNPDELVQFCRQARRISSVRSIALTKMLSGMSSPEYLMLLKDYANSDDEELRNSAFKGLSKGNNTARKEVMLELLKSDSNIIRKKACENIGQDIDSEVEAELTLLLSDSDVSVVCSALKILRNSSNRNVLKHCEKLLNNANVNVRVLALGVLQNADSSRFSVGKVAACLEKDDDDRVRIEACRILGEKVPSKVIDVFEKILNDKLNSDLLRQQAVRAIGKIEQKIAVRILFDIIIEDRFASRVVGECRKVLSRFESAVLLELAEKQFETGIVLRKFEAVRVLGMFTDRMIEAFLKDRLYLEHEEIVLAAIIDELAKFGALSIWDFVKKEASNKDRPLVAYSASQAASELLVPDKLDEFIEILRKYPERMIAEVILKRLVLFGKDRGLPEKLQEIIKLYMVGGVYTVNLFAIDVAGYVGNLVLVPKMLDMISDFSEQNILNELTISIMNGVKGSMYKLLCIAGDERLREVSAIIARINRNDIVGGLNEYFECLAEKAEHKISGARLCLTISASKFHQEYLRAIEYVGDKELAYLLYIWASLPHSIREGSSFNWGRALDNSRVAVRVAALRAMSGVDIENYICDVADIAFDDPRAEARNAAKIALQSVINN